MTSARDGDGDGGGDGGSSSSSIYDGHKIGLFDPHVLEYKKLGSRSSRFGMRFFQNDMGRGTSEVSMDNDMTDNGGKFEEKGRWRKRGWKVCSL